MVEETIRNYQPSTPHIEAVDGDHIRAFCGDDIPALGSAVAFESESGETVYGVVQRHSGARRVEIWLPEAPDWLEENRPIRPTTKPAGFARPQAEAIKADSTLIRPAEDDDILFWPRAPEMVDLDGKRAALSIGVEVVDTLSPMAWGGVNLIINASDEPAIFSRLVQRAYSEIKPATTLMATSSALEIEPQNAEAQIWRVDPSNSLHENIAALQIVTALGAALRESGAALAAVDLPRLRQTGYTPPDPSSPRFGLPQIIDRLGRHLVSTTEGSVTTFLHLRIADELRGLRDIIDTLHLGDVDSLIYIDAQGRFDPERSTSRADIDEKTSNRRQELHRLMSLAKKAREKSAIFGEDDLTPAQKRALAKVEELRPSLAHPS